MIAKASEDTQAIVAMERTCRAWRAAIQAQGDEIWMPALCRRIPRLREILQNVSTHPPLRELYAMQLDAEVPHREEEFFVREIAPNPVQWHSVDEAEAYWASLVTTTISDYLFSVEMLHDGKVVATRTSIVDVASLEDGEWESSLEWGIGCPVSMHEPCLEAVQDEYCRAERNATDRFWGMTPRSAQSISARIIVTRKSDLRAICLYSSRPWSQNRFVEAEDTGQTFDRDEPYDPSQLRLEFQMHTMPHTGRLWTNRYADQTSNAAWRAYCYCWYDYQEELLRPNIGWLVGGWNFRITSMVEYLELFSPLAAEPRRPQNPGRIDRLLTELSIRTGVVWRGSGWFTEAHVSAYYGDRDVSELLWAVAPLIFLAAVIILPVLGWYLFPEAAAQTGLPPLDASFLGLPGMDRWFIAWMASGALVIAFAERRGWVG